MVKMNIMTEIELLQIKEDIATAKEKVAEKTGHLKALKKEMQDKWNVNSTEEAKKLLAGKKNELDKITEKYNSNIERLEEIYDIQ